MVELKQHKYEHDLLGITTSGTGGDTLWTASGNDIHNTNTGNVGIGIVNPGSKLAVNGQISSNNLWLGGFSSDWPWPDAISSQIQLGSSLAFPAQSYVNSDITNISAYITKDYPSSFRWGRILDISVGGGDSGSFIRFLTQAPGAASSVRMIITTSGLVGIGTETPTQQLDVNGSIAVAGTVDGVDISVLNSSYVTHSGDNTIHFTVSSINHHSLLGLTDDDHPQYLTSGRADSRYLLSGSYVPVTVSDTASIDLTIAGQQISATVLPAGVHHGALSGLNDDDHTQYALLAGRSGKNSFVGNIDVTGNITASGNAGVGIDPSTRLHMVGTAGGGASTDNTFTLQRTDATNPTARIQFWGSSGASGPKWGIMGDEALTNALLIQYQATGGFSATAGSTSFLFTNTGWLGLGCVPKYALDITNQGSAGHFGITPVSTFYTDIVHNAYFNSGWKSYGGGPASSILMAGGSSQVSSIVFRTCTEAVGTAVGATVSLADRMTIDAAGQVGVNCTPGKQLDVGGVIRSLNGEHICDGISGPPQYGQFRAISGNYGFFIRNDGVDTYLMLTNSLDQYGNWNSFRPFTIGNANGDVRLVNSAVVAIHSTGGFYLAEAATPTALANYGGLFARSDGHLRYWNDSSVETNVSRATTYASLYAGSTTAISFGNSTTFLPVAGYTGSSTVEAQQCIKIAGPGRFFRPALYITANTLNGTTTVYVRDDGGNAMSYTIAAGATGWREDTSGTSVAFVDQSAVCLYVVTTGSTSGSMSVRTAQLDVF